MSLTPGSKTISSGFLVGRADITEDDSAFPCEIADRRTGRAQNIVRGTFTLVGVYKTGGLGINFQKKTSRFPIANSPRIVVQMDSTCSYYGVVDHTNKKLMAYTDLGAEVSDANARVNGLIFPFLAAGE